MGKLIEGEFLTIEAFDKVHWRWRVHVCEFATLERVGHYYVLSTSSKRVGLAIEDTPYKVLAKEWNKFVHRYGTIDALVRRIDARLAAERLKAVPRRDYSRMIANADRKAQAAA
ncbi:hypothetical protein GGQ64_003271 [Rhizobium azooxidifex]|uniref:Uncharacterized protein n=1 Tax=Mycoplana azooxidifex TaxID=1636188 RepID=A0A7W6DCE7_9HYPH|nr:hypothetical protein [Mycoplana azooxidifex]MBB3978057.1 hypothetical protein [Mycoplana azooxidifex]